MDCSPPGSSVHGILQARILEWVAIPFRETFLIQGSNVGPLHCRQILYHLSHQGSPSRACSVQSLSCVQLFVTPWTAAHQASLSITNSQSLPKLIYIELVMSSNHLILCCPFSSHLQSFPAPFPISQLFTSGGQCIGVSASASVLPMNIQD